MVEEYATLLEIYRRMFDMVDVFHFNSQNTSDVYGKYLSIPTKSKVIHITHSGIQDYRKLRNYDEHLLRLGFIGSEAPYKGIPMLKKVIGMLNQKGYSDKVELHVYGGKIGQDDKLSNVFYKGRFTSTMMDQVFNDMDLLVVPSICHETFSLVTMEALSFGTCALVSDKVGAKDLVAHYDPRFVFKGEQDLHDIIKELIEHREALVHYNQSIVSSPWSWSIERHAKDIVDTLYRK